MSGQVYPRGRNWALRARAEVQKLGPGKELRVKFRHYSGVLRGCSKTLLRLSAGLHSHSSRSLTHASGFNTGCSGLKTEMDFDEVKIRV